jgi:hypothetical protein
MFQRLDVVRALALLLAFAVICPSFAVNPNHLGEIFRCSAEIQKSRYIYCEQCAEVLTDIRLNESLFRSNVKKVSYGTIIQIDGLKDWTHGNVVDLTFAAHAKFVKQFNEDTRDGNPNRIPTLNERKDRPAVTTTLVRNKAALSWTPPGALR